MTSLNEISFKRTDRIPAHLESATEELADHFKVRRDYIPQYCRLINTSKRWTVDAMDSQLQRWENFFPKIPGSKKLIDIVNRRFKSCVDEEEIHKLRGLMVEALIIGCKGGTKVLNNPKYGWGALVNIHHPDKTVIPVIYECLNPIDSNCKRRSTVDFGHWNGLHGKFYECKAQPASIGCKEIQYMKTLKSELSSKKISHEIFFVCAEPRDEVKIKLEIYGLSPVFQPVGIEEIKMMMPA